MFKETKEVTISEDKLKEILAEKYDMDKDNIRLIFKIPHCGEMKQVKIDCGFSITAIDSVTKLTFHEMCNL